MGPPVTRRCADLGTCEMRGKVRGVTPQYRDARTYLERMWSHALRRRQEPVSFSEAVIVTIEVINGEA